MTFFSYVDRQKMRIRENHSGEESIYLRGEAVQIKGAEGEAVRKNYAERPSEEDKFVAAAMRAERLMRELKEMAGLDRRERERFLKEANAVEARAGRLVEKLGAARLAPHRLFYVNRGIYAGQFTCRRI